jgi:hypothetical protein
MPAAFLVRPDHPNALLPANPDPGAPAAAGLILARANQLLPRLQPAGGLIRNPGLSPRHPETVSTPPRFFREGAGGRGGAPGDDFLTAEGGQPAAELQGPQAQRTAQARQVGCLRRPHTEAHCAHRAGPVAAGPFPDAPAGSPARTFTHDSLSFRTAASGRRQPPVDTSEQGADAPRSPAQAPAALRSGRLSRKQRMSPARQRVARRVRRIGAGRIPRAVQRQTVRGLTANQHATSRAVSRSVKTKSGADISCSRSACGTVPGNERLGGRPGCARQTTVH